METTTTTTPTTPTTLATSTRTNAQKQQGCLQPNKVLMLASYLTAENVDDTTLTHALLLVTTVERQDIRPKTAELHLALQTKEDPEAKDDRVVMLLVSDVVRKDTTRTSVQTMGIKAVGIKFEATRKTLRTSTQVGCRAPGRVYSLCAEAAVKDNNVVNGGKEVQQQAQYYTEEDWDLIRARMEASTELSKSVFGTDIDAEDYAKKMVELVEKRRREIREQKLKAKKNKPMTQTE
ncbi:hypothetical protein Tco_0449286 [Tanacetum coccineum]